MRYKFPEIVYKFRFCSRITLQQIKETQMNDKEKISCCSFLRGSIQAGGALIVASALPVQAAGLSVGYSGSESGSQRYGFDGRRGGESRLCLTG